jgi:thioredoxin reductase (NADPH)
MRASKIMQHRVENNDKVEILWNTEVLDVHGEDAVTGIRIINNQTQEERDLDLTGFFLAIGHKPNSDAFGKWLKTDETGYILTQPDSTATDYPGVFACGDVQDHVYRQAITAAGSGCMSALEAERWLEEKLHS